MKDLVRKSTVLGALSAAAVLAVVVAWTLRSEPVHAQPAPSEIGQPVHVDRAAQRAAYRASLADRTPRGEHAKMLARAAKAAACLPQEASWHGGVDDQEDIYCLRRCTSDADCMGESARCVLTRPFDNDHEEDNPDEPIYADEVELEADEEGMCMPRRFLIAAGPAAQVAPQ